MHNKLNEKFVMDFDLLIRKWFSVIHKSIASFIKLFIYIFQIIVL